ncbi:hypothetical protein PBT90_12750 [Algoriphagus halophytocola]|uniref:hypothetical protein n=1 Tax=Algoriphagus halophytocola TaxID=2991499 RepID=UPI0022DD402C|nr:hypothetical protein [Algoriphagus sp. TR-M9]WBL41623.1 hypothetical protein PBT90_12750 [Algoriphagus sp. TR-M9]
MSRFGDFELWYNQIFALVAVFLMIALPVASLSAVKGMRNIRIDAEAPAKLLEKFSKSKVQFWKVQRYGIICGVILLICILPPLTELNGSEEIVYKPWFWGIYIPGGLVFLVLFSRWVLKKYRRVMDSSEVMLKELE